MNLVYLASPYLYRGLKSDYETDARFAARCSDIQRQRYEEAIDASVWLMNKGYSVISPIVLTHPLALRHMLPLGSEYWMQFDEVLLNKCDEMMILMIDGVLESPGVKREFQINRLNNKDTRLLIPDSQNKGSYFINDMDWETRDCLEI